jgi:hypothetical protein
VGAVGRKNASEMISGMISAELALAQAAQPQTNWAGRGGRTATTAWFWVTPATGGVIG